MNSKIYCLVCDSKKISILYSQFYDYEYEIASNRSFYSCNNCKLIFLYKYYTESEIPLQYPNDYGTYKSINRKNIFFYLLKKILLNRKIKKISLMLPKNASLLEIGCGSGDLLNYLKKVRPDLELYGLDIVELPIKKNFSFIKGQFENIKIDKKFNLIIFSNLIEHTVNPKLFLQKCHKNLIEKGHIIGETPSTNSIDRGIFGKFWGGYHYPRHTFLFNKKNLQILMRKCNFVDININGSYAYWAVSFFNFLIKENGRKKRGLIFFIITIFFIPIDIIINLFFDSGNLNFKAKKVKLEK